MKPENRYSSTPSACAPPSVRAAVRAATQRRGSSTAEQSEVWLLAARGDQFRERQGRQRRLELARTVIITAAFFGAWYVPQLAVYLLGGAR